MFQRRLKLVLLALLAVVFLIAARAAQVQVWQHDDWTATAANLTRKPELIETVRGSIVDRKGRELAVDRACIDACINYQAIAVEPNRGWLIGQARERRERKRVLLAPGESLPTVSQEIESVKADIANMWTTLAQLPGQSQESIAQVRQAIIQKVETRRKYIWYRNYEQAIAEARQRGPQPWYRRWLSGSDLPQMEEFEVDVSEEREWHPILRAVDAETNNFLAKQLAVMPGMILRAGVHRDYPYGDVAAHVIGNMSRVNREDLAADPWAQSDDPRHYRSNDLIGRNGLEALAERTLRGTRGVLTRDRKTGIISDQSEPARGTDVHATIDIELQRDIQQLFADWKLVDHDHVVERHAMHGAAVVIDVQTNQLLALVSYPTYDLNRLDELYAQLVKDDVNQPMLHRATMSALEPGSTMKPLVGLAAVAGGFVTVDSTVACNGYLISGGKQQATGRCWTMTRFQTTHRQMPYADPHPTGNLTLTDAIQRSCNVYFETMGDRMGVEKLSDWMSRFGLGSPTGIGLPESSGRLPNSFNLPKYLKRSTSWYAAIGQGKVGATPLQMANVAATIARGGTWNRPLLISDKLPSEGLSPSTQPTRPDVVDLQLPRAAIKAVRDGMYRVVNTKGGTGNVIARKDMNVAGKTGTAQTHAFSYRQRDEKGDYVKDAKGQPVRTTLAVSTPDHPNRLAPWHRGSGNSGTDLSHAWFIGYAPAENPRIAFAVMVEYGGSGGTVAGPVVNGLLDAAIRHGYLAGRVTDEAVGFAR